MGLTSVKILNIRISGINTAEVLKTVLAANKPLVIFTPNPEFLVEANRNLKFREILNQADINLPDGYGLILAGKLLGQPIFERVSGASLVEKLLEAGNERGWQVGIAGARRGELEETKVLFGRLAKKYPSIKFVNVETLPGKPLSPAESAGQLPLRKGSLNENPPFFKGGKPALPEGGFNIVLACHGMIKQETWILENKDTIKAKVFLGAGGSLDFLTGFTRRAPVWVRELGFEWLWRGLTKSGHWHRIWTAVCVFPYLVLKSKLTNE